MIRHSNCKATRFLYLLADFNNGMILVEEYGTFSTDHFLIILAIPLQRAISMLGAGRENYCMQTT